MERNIFVTGASGFLGKALVENMLKENKDIFYFLVRSERSEELLKEKFKWVDPERIRFVAGDITSEYAGLSHINQETMKRKINEVWHIAASTNFDESKKSEIRLSNIGGTKNVLQLVRDFSRLDSLVYISTAYVCGKDIGCIPEDRIESNYGFKNPYEESKLIAENLVRDSSLPSTIIRPSIIVGDSKTGTAKGENRMIYGYLSALYYSALHYFGSEKEFKKYWSNIKEDCSFADLNSKLYGDSSVSKNLVTLDDLVNVCIHIRNSQDKRGKTYNVVNPQNVYTGFMADTMQKKLKVKGFKFAGNISRNSIKLENKVELAAYKYTKPFFPYVTFQEPVWEYGNVNNLGVNRVLMTEKLFDHLMESYVKNELIVDS